LQTVSMRQVKLPSFMVVGITNDLSPLGMKGTWDQLYARMSEIPWAVNPKVGYGLLIDRRYTACIEVSSMDNIPAGMDGITVPANDYAVFTHKGKLTFLKQTWDAIHNQFATGLDMTQPNFERYDERFNPISDDSVMEIFIPMGKGFH